MKQSWQENSHQVINTKHRSYSEKRLKGFRPQQKVEETKFFCQKLVIWWHKDDQAKHFARLRSVFSANGTHLVNSFLPEQRSKNN